GWRVDPRAESNSRGEDVGRFIAPEELIDAIDGVRVTIARQREAMSKPEAKRKAAALDTLLARCPKEWSKQPRIDFALAAAFADLGPDYFEKSCELYSAAIASEDREG